MKQCPVCESELSDPMPSFCNHCAWDIENDPTLNEMLLPLPDNALAKHQKKIELAKKSLKKNQKAFVNQKDLENELRLMQKKFAELEKYIRDEQKKKADFIKSQEITANEQNAIKNDLHLIQKKLAELESCLKAEKEKKESSKRLEIEKWTKKAASASASDEKITCYTKLIELNSEDIQAYFERACVYDGQGRYDNAIADYSEAIRLDPKFALAYNNRGVAHYHKRKYDPAIADYSEAIRLDPNFAPAYNNRGIAYKNQGSYDNAIADYSEAIRLDPKYIRAYDNRSNLYKKMGKTALAKQDADKVKLLKKQERQ